MSDEKRKLNEGVCVGKEEAQLLGAPAVKEGEGGTLISPRVDR